MKKLCLGLMGCLKTPVKNQIALYSSLGFDGFFTGWSYGLDLKEFRKNANEQGMIYQSVHAPFTKMAHLWRPDEDMASAAENELVSCLEAVSGVEVPICVMHAFIGFDEHDPREEYLCRFDRIIERAKELGVTVAFENTEGEEYLDMLLTHFESCPGVRFCWDSGHEMCYNHSRDLIAKYGKRLVCTHINDNLGISGKNGKTTWLDDLHLLPGDGTGDWEYNAKRLAGLELDTLTFELTVNSKPGRNENDRYKMMTDEAYLCEVYKRGKDFARLVEAWEDRA